VFAGYIGSCVDITERKEAEEAAKAADRRKDEFLATLAHELRNPLAPIGNALEIIKQAENDRDAVRLARDTMERQFAQMVRLVDDLLDVGRITRDKLELRRQTVEMASVIHQAVETSRLLAEQNGHEMQVVLPPTSLQVHADPVRLAQVFSNLLNNACKFTEPGGTISITAERRDGEALVLIKDTGIGIAPDMLGSIFEMFEQADKSLEKTRGGLGIGLTLVKRLVELHGGSIEAKSEGLGRGSEFVVRLPALVNGDNRPAAPPLRFGTKTATPRRILITDDNRDAADSLGMLLKLSGHEVEMAYDGPEALRKAETFKPNVALLDIGLPEMNGCDVCRAIRQQPWGRGVRLIALTGWGQDSDRRITREAGFDHHLVKPVDLEALHDVLEAKPADSTV
jgi:CheY-like chemotaxis protein